MSGPRLSWGDWLGMAVLVAAVLLAGVQIGPTAAGASDCGCGDPHGCVEPCPTCCGGMCPCKGGPGPAADGCR